jgi:hypothetical protein
MVYRASVRRATRNSGSLFGRVDLSLVLSETDTAQTEPHANAGLTGAFLFASTTARSSSALLGWNCGYAFFSNVRM